jgi:hypothetical protein
LVWYGSHFYEKITENGQKSTVYLAVDLNGPSRKIVRFAAVWYGTLWYGTVRASTVYRKTANVLVGYKSRSYEKLAFKHKNGKILNALKLTLKIFVIRP